MTPKTSVTQLPAGPLQDKDVNTKTPTKGTRMVPQSLYIVAYQQLEREE